MSPEVVNGGRATKEADIFAVGLIIYEILTGRTPVDDVAMQEKRTRGELPKEIDLSVADMVERCLSKEPEVRPTINEIFDVFRAIRFGLLSDVDCVACERFVSEVTEDEMRMV
jgi:serine/threonine protein kinase